MKALEKVCSHFYKVTAIIFSIILPQSIRLTILIIRASWSWYKRASSKHKYMAAINKKSCKFVYTKELRRLRSEPLVCSICLSDFEEGEEGRELLQCKHRFHRNCIEKWLQGRHSTCPLCRGLVIPNEIVAEYQISQIVEENNSSEEELALLFLSSLHLHGSPTFNSTDKENQTILQSTRKSKAMDNLYTSKSDIDCTHSDA